MAPSRKYIVKNGDRFGHLTVICEIAPVRYPSGVVVRMVKCKCDCGNETTVALRNLVAAKHSVKSCGCDRGRKKVFTDEEAKARNRASSRRYYAEHREHALELGKNWYQQNKDRVREYKRNWYQQNKDRLKEKRKYKEVANGT